MRRALALVLLFAHASAAAHLALAAHALGDTGVVVDAQPECAEPSHGSAGIAHGHQLGCDERECQSIALVRTAAMATAPALPAPAPVETAPTVQVLLADASPPLAVLSVAPKSSPPV